MPDDPLYTALLPPPAYMGDGVYIRASGWGTCVDVTTEDGITVTNRIVLEPEVWRALVRYMDELETGVRRLLTAREHLAEIESSDAV